MNKVKEKEKIKDLVSDNELNEAFCNIRKLVINSRNRVYSVVNNEMLNLYWNIGKLIMEIQQGDIRATYGDAVLENLSVKLTNEFGKGFSSRNLRTMRKFYLNECINSGWSVRELRNPNLFIII